MLLKYTRARKHTHTHTHTHTRARIYIYISSSSSSSRFDNTESFDSLAIRPNRPWLLEGSLECIDCPHNVEISVFCSGNTDVFMCRIPQETVTNKIIRAFLAMFCSSYLDSFWDGR